MTEARARTATRTTGPRPTRWLDDEEMAAWRGYVDTFGALVPVLEADLAPHGLTVGDYEVLVRLSEAEHHQMRMCDLAQHLRLSPSGLTRRLDGLVRGQLVRREPSAQDRRVMLATLTDRGRRVLERAAPDHVDSVRRHVLDHLSTDEVRTLAVVFGRLRAALDRGSGAPEEAAS